MWNVYFLQKNTDSPSFPGPRLCANSIICHSKNWFWKPVFYWTQIFGDICTLYSLEQFIWKPFFYCTNKRQPSEIHSLGWLLNNLFFSWDIDDYKQLPSHFVFTKNTVNNTRNSPFITSKWRWIFFTLADKIDTKWKLKHGRLIIRAFFLTFSISYMKNLSLTGVNSGFTAVILQDLCQIAVCPTNLKSDGGFFLV